MTLNSLRSDHNTSKRLLSHRKRHMFRYCEKSIKNSVCRILGICRRLFTPFIAVAQLFLSPTIKRKKNSKCKFN